MKLLLVDDEPPARAKLRRFLTTMPQVEIVGEAGDGQCALELVSRQRVDAVLLDIQMPRMGGLEVAAALPPGVHVVFVTAYDKHAVRAFELNAIDYLLKPYTRERFAACIDRLRERLADRTGRRQSLQNALHQLQPVPGHWMVPTRSGLCRLALADVECVEAADNYVELHTAGHSYLDRSTLAGFLAHPVAAAFVRVHRRFAIQPAHIREIVPLARGDAEILLKSGRRVRLSRRYRDNLIKAGR
jgi:two-component system, LytTR family, response regulator